MDVYNYITPILLALYLIISNVMLLNLLIAIFTSVFEEVHDNSKELWKWEMYR
jgi:transient receptor potential cation channel subfamily M protein 2